MNLDPTGSTELAAIREKFDATRANTIDAFRRLADRLAVEPDAPELIETLRRELHRIRGTAGTFGFPAASELAGAFEERAVRWAADPAFERGQRESLVRRFLSALEEKLAGQAMIDDIDEPVPELTSLLLFVGDDTLAPELRAEAALRSMRLRAMTPEACTVDAVRAIAPHAVLATMPVDRRIAEIARSLNLPLVALETREPRARGGDAEAVNASVTVDATNGVGPAFEVAGRLLVSTGWSGATILAVDDSPVVLMLLRALFPAPEFDLQTLESGAGFFDKLADTQPALLVLDIELPDTNGLTLLRQLRARREWRDLPVVVLSGRSDQETRAEAFDAGADEFVAKPIVVSELRARVGDRLERRRAARLAAGLHPVTGIPFPERAAREGALAIDTLSAQGAPTVVAVLRTARLDPSAASSAAWVRESARIARAVTADGYGIGYGADQELVLVLSGGIDATLPKLMALAAGAPPEAAWFAGVADVADVPDPSYVGAQRAAVEAVDAARRDGGTPIRAWTRVTSQLAPDVILVEDDPSLSDMIQYALRSTGFTYEAFDDGLVALDRLVAFDTEHRHPIVLLDVDLPGIDGYTLHDRLRERRPGIYNVIFVTVRSAETDQLRALHAGAMDFISKPINLRVLMAKMTSWLSAARRRG
jgi:DNA-binding response OmpR family regulator/HPt (histidine-containing phosphotransfer) domain-containing protein